MKSYFSHDSNARNSDKLMKVRMGLGAEGYGIFFMLIERLREGEGYKSTIDYDTLAFDLRVEPEKVKQVVENYDLFKFTEDGKYFYSDSFNERMEMMDKRAQQRISKAKKAAEARWNKQSEDTSNAQALPKQCSSNAQALLNHANKIKLNKTKLNKIKLNKTKLNKIKLNKTKLNKIKLNKTKPEESKPDKELVTGGGSTDNDVQELIEMYQEKFGVCNPLVINDIQNSLTMFDKDVVIESFRLSIGKDNPYLYMKGIWKKWKDEGVITLEQVQASNARHEKNKPTNYKKGGYVEIVPDWAN